MKSRSLRGSSGRGLLGQGLAQAFVLGMLFVPRGLVAQQTVTPAQPLQPWNLKPIQASQISLEPMRAPGSPARP